MKMIKEMKMIVIVMILISMILVIGNPCFAYNLLNGELDPWTNEQIDMQISLTILAILDYGTTNYGLQYPDRFYETESGIYGHPTSQQVLEYGLKLYFGHLLISYLLPSKTRDFWLTIANLYQIKCVGNNLYIGCKLKF